MSGFCAKNKLFFFFYFYTSDRQISNQISL